MENSYKLLKKIKGIYTLLLIASLVAMVLGFITIGRGVIGLTDAIKNNASELERGECIIELLEGLILIVHYFFVTKFLMTVQRERYPFHYEAAKEMKVIGWETIILLLLLEVATLFIYAGHKPIGEIIELEIYEIVLGVFLIQTGYLMEYATNKIIRGHKFHLMTTLIQNRYPEIFKEVDEESDQLIFNEKNGIGSKLTE